jgi:hypothetical protein
MSDGPGRRRTFVSVRNPTLDMLERVAAPLGTRLEVDLSAA